MRIIRVSNLGKVRTPIVPELIYRITDIFGSFLSFLHTAHFPGERELSGTSTIAECLGAHDVAHA